LFNGLYDQRAAFFRTLHVEALLLKEIEQQWDEVWALGGKTSFSVAQTLQQKRADHLKQFSIVAVKDAGMVTVLELIQLEDFWNAGHAKNYLTVVFLLGLAHMCAEHLVSKSDVAGVGVFDFFGDERVLVERDEARAFVTGLG